MRTTATLLCLALGAAPAVPGRAHATDHAVRPPKADLDLNADFDDDDPPLPSPRPAAPTREASRAWIYWTAAAGTLAAAGGFGWYWRQRADAVRTVREEQVFTDER